MLTGLSSIIFEQRSTYILCSERSQLYLSTEGKVCLMHSFFHAFCQMMSNEQSTPSVPVGPSRHNGGTRWWQQYDLQRKNPSLLHWTSVHAEHTIVSPQGAASIQLAVHPFKLTDILLACDGGTFHPLGYLKKDVCLTQTLSFTLSCILTLTFTIQLVKATHPCFIVHFSRWSHWCRDFFYILKVHYLTLTFHFMMCSIVSVTCWWPHT